ncbi:MAG: hypothetical protein ACRC12_04165 [Holosporales bacterium]
MKKNIKIFLSGVMLLGANAFAAKDWKMSPYVGIKGGVVDHPASYKKLSIGENIGFPGGTLITLGGRSLQPLGHLVFGCQWKSKHYFALDCTVGSQGGAIQFEKIDGAPGDQLRNFKVSLKHPFDAGGTLRMGYMLGESVLFMGAGLVYGRWNLHLTNDNGRNLFGLDPNTSTHFGKAALFFKPGLGIIVPLDKCWNVVLEYNFLCGPSISKTLTCPSVPTPPAPATLTSWKHSMKIRQQSIQLGINYHFKTPG